MKKEHSSPPPESPGKKGTPAAAVTGQIPEAQSMDKIRDILFGNQARDYEKRFSRMESQLAQESQDLKTELLKRIDALESYFKQEIKDINLRIKNETDDRVHGQEDLRKDLKERFESLNKKLVQEEENLARKSSELRDQILEQSKQLTSEILSRSDQAATSLKQTARELDTAKVNRSDLSGFFLELAMRLSNDEAMGGSDPNA